LSDPNKTPDWWCVPTFAVWLVYLFVGFMPEPFFLHIQELARVAQRNAMVNRPAFITVFFAGYMAFFVLRVCRREKVPEMDALGRAIQIGVAALVAFLPGVISVLPYAAQTDVTEQKVAIYVLAAGKGAAWLYLFWLLFRFYCFGDRRVFAETSSVFPSSYVHHPKETPGEEAGQHSEAAGAEKKQTTAK